MICFNFITEKKRLFERLVEENIVKKEDIFRAIDFKEEYLNIDYYEWNFKKSKQNFNTAEEMAEYLKEINFKFEDNTAFNP